jgi:hypothetical protein
MVGLFCVFSVTQIGSTPCDTARYLYEAMIERPLAVLFTRLMTLAVAIAATVCFPLGCSREPHSPVTLTQPGSWRDVRTLIDFSSVRIDGASTPAGVSLPAHPAAPVGQGIDGLFVETGAYFRHLTNTPTVHRKTVEICSSCWVVAELATLRREARVEDFLSIVEDPETPGNRVLNLRTRDHTDGVILRSRFPLPENYRISLRIGYIDYGSEHSLNGYDSGDERGAPWMDIPAIGHNGVYWLAITDTLPRPHNNVWSHHHRKFFIDAWNTPKRMYGVTVAGVDGLSVTDGRLGKHFVAHDGNGWQQNSTTPAFFYEPFQWYSVQFTRNDGVMSFEVRGTGLGERDILSGSLDVDAECVYHYNRTAEELAERCMHGELFELDGRLYPVWPRESAYPDYFMMGDPHINFYEGSVLIDDLKLEIL